MASTLGDFVILVNKRSVTCPFLTRGIGVNVCVCVVPDTEEGFRPGRGSMCSGAVARGSLHGGKRDCGCLMTRVV